MASHSEAAGDQKFHSTNSFGHQTLQGVRPTPKYLRRLFFVILSIAALAGCLRLRNDYLDGLKKATATDFSRLRASGGSLWLPDYPVRYSNGTHIDDRYTYIKPLGNGRQGIVKVYKDNSGQDFAVKTFFQQQTRNHIPLELVGDFIDWTTTWPAEIEAGILLNNLWNASFVAVLDYFILQEQDTWSWAVVSPLLSGGTLLNLAERDYQMSTPDKLDSIFRWSLKNLLLAVENLHTMGLCHDDIKPENILIGGDRFQWMLGDISNIREITHPWHGTASRLRQNQLSDCKANDVKRTLKTYLIFIRAACRDEDVFDREFWARKSAWSRMYWDYTVYPMEAGRLVKIFDILYPQNDTTVPGRMGEVAVVEGNLGELTLRELAPHA